MLGTVTKENETIVNDCATITTESACHIDQTQEW